MPEHRRQPALQAGPECHEDSVHHRASSLPRDLLAAGRQALHTCAHQHEPHSSPRRNRPPGNDYAPASSAPARLACPPTSSLPGASRISSTAAHQAQTLNPHKPQAALSIPRVRSLEAFGRRPRASRINPCRPSSETLHKLGLPERYSRQEDRSRFVSGPAHVIGTAQNAIRRHSSPLSHRRETEVT